MNVLVDTNVLLDVLQGRQPHAAPGVQVWGLVEQGAVAGFVSAISYNNVFYVARKQAGAAMAMDAVRLVRRTFRTVALDEPIVDRAMGLAVADFEDAIQIAAAERVGADYIVTRDASGFRGSSIPAVTAESLLAILRKP